MGRPKKEQESIDDRTIMADETVVMPEATSVDQLDTIEQEQEIHELPIETPSIMPTIISDTVVPRDSDWKNLEEINNSVPKTIEVPITKVEPKLSNLVKKVSSLPPVEKAIVDKHKIDRRNAGSTICMGGKIGNMVRNK
jgi:hypothetical protein